MSDPIIELEYLAMKDLICRLQREITKLQAEVELLRAALDHMVKSTNLWP